MPAKTFCFSSYEPAIRFHLSSKLTKLGWQVQPNQALAHLTDKHLTINDDISILLEYKHLCALLIQRFCPHICLETFALNDINYRQVIENLWYHKDAKKPWILKPSLLNNGDHIHLFENMKSVVAHYTQTKRLSGDHVLQRYLDKPKLWGDRKFTLRIPGVLTSDKGVFLYKHGYMNISALPFETKFNTQDRRTHITNYILDGQLANITQLSTHDYPDFDIIYPKICKILMRLMKAVTAVFPEYLAKKQHKAFEIFGFDFIVDSRNTPYLLEVNQGPDFPMIKNHPLNQVLWDPFWQAMIDSFVEPIVSNIEKNKLDDFCCLLDYHQATSRHWLAKIKGERFLKRFGNLITIQK